MSQHVCIAAVMLLLVTAGAADTYWVNYDPVSENDPNELPEFQGWERHYGGGGAERWIENGTFAIDSRADQWIRDSATYYAPIHVDPGQLFVAEWRLLISDSLGYGDVGIAFAGDVNEEIVFTFRLNRIYSLFEQWEYFFTPGEFHTYRLESWEIADQAPYRLWIDGELVRDGYWDGPTFIHSYVDFGDCWVAGNGGSLSYWDYFRFGVVPELNAVGLILPLAACYSCRPR